MTHCLDLIKPSVKFHEYIHTNFQHYTTWVFGIGKLIQWRSTFLEVGSKFIKEWQSYGPDTKKDPIFDLWLLSVTLALELQTWVLWSSHPLMMVNIFAKSFQNSSRNGKVIDWMKKRPYFWPLTSKCDLGATDLVLTCYTSSHDCQYFCQVISKSIKEWQSYWPDTKKRPYFWHLSSVCPWPWSYKPWSCM